jgi:hypothetical protein
MQQQIIVQIYFSLLRGQSKLMIATYYILFLELDLVLQSCQGWIIMIQIIRIMTIFPKFLYWSWELWHIIPTYKQILTITKFVA